jgi:S-DNA-T family DNA segregation ATPase FtsK/SpoIIIE
MATLVVRKRTLGDVLFALLGLIIVWLVKQLAKLIAFVTLQMVKHWRTTLTLAALVAAVWWRGWVTVAIVLASALVLASIWRAAHPSTFHRYSGRT